MCTCIHSGRIFVSLGANEHNQELPVWVIRVGFSRLTVVLKCLALQYPV